MDMEVDHHPPCCFPAGLSCVFLNGSGERGLGFFRFPGLPEIVLDLDLGPLGFQIRSPDEPGGIPGRFAALQDQVRKMPAGLPAHDLLDLLGKILIDPKSHRLLKEREGPGTFGILHPIPASLNGQDLQTGKAEVQVNLQTINIVFQYPVDRQPVYHPSDKRWSVYFERILAF